MFNPPPLGTFQWNSPDHFPANYEWLNIGSWDAQSCLYSSTVSPRQLIFVWCTLSDTCQMTVRSCLPDASPYICQLQPDICQTSTTITPDRYHTSDRCLVYVWWTSGTCLTDVWWELTDVWLDIWQSSGDHLKGNTRQIATVWGKRWCPIYKLKNSDLVWSSIANNYLSYEKRFTAKTRLPTYFASHPTDMIDW